MPNKQEKNKQEKSPNRDIVSSDSMKGALNKALSTVSSPTLPERSGGSNSTYYPFSASTPILGNIGIPSMGSVYDTVRDYSSPLSLAAMGMMGMNRPRVPQNNAPYSPPMNPAELPPEMIPVGAESAFNRPRMPIQTGPTDQALYNIARQKFGMGMDMPSTGR